MNPIARSLMVPADCAIKAEQAFESARRLAYLGNYHDAHGMAMNACLWMERAMEIADGDFRRAMEGDSQ